MRLLSLLIVCAGLVLSMGVPAQAAVKWDPSFVKQELEWNEFALTLSVLAVPDLQPMLEDTRFPIRVILTDDVYASVKRLLGPKDKVLSDGSLENISKGIAPLAGTIWDEDTQSVLIFVLTSEYTMENFHGLCDTLMHEFVHALMRYDRHVRGKPAPPTASITEAERREEIAVYSMVIHGYARILREGSFQRLVEREFGAHAVKRFVHEANNTLRANYKKLHGYIRLLKEAEQRNVPG